MKNLNLDEKVFGRDSVYIAAGQEQLGGFLSKIHKKVKKLTKKIADPLTKKVYKKVSKTGLYKSMKKFESKHRKDLKKIGAIAAAAVAAYFVGPAALQWIQGAGGKLLASEAAKKVGTALITNKIKEKLSEKQQKELQEQLQQQFATDPAGIFNNPMLQQISQEIAAQEGVQETTPYTVGESGLQKLETQAAGATIAIEGAQEIAHQTEKVASPDWQKFIIPAAGVLAVILMRG